MSKKEVSKFYTDDNVVRIIAAQVVILTLVALILKLEFILLFLIADFALRAFTFLPSPLAAAAKLIALQLKLKQKPIFASPKKFAAGIGFVFSLSTLILFLLGLYIPASIVGGVLIFCAVLESAFKVCLGCYVYDWLIAPVENLKN